jgi:RNA polymerase sigma factor (sigma-70 family)
MSETVVKTKWQLTQDAFDRLLAALSANRDEAGEKYLLLRNNLVNFFEIRNVPRAEDSADEVLNRLARKLESGEALENPKTYALGIARMVALEARRIPEQTADEELPEIAAAPFNDDDEATQKESKLKCLEKCLGELSPENRGIIVGYYQGEKSGKIENRRKLADRLGIPQTALRNRAVRLRDKLEVCITDCLG